MGSAMVDVNAIYKDSQEGNAHEAPLEDGSGRSVSNFIRIHWLLLESWICKNIEIGRLGLGSTDPFYEVYKKHSSLSTGKPRWQLIHRFETIKNHLNPMWNEEELNMEAFCDNEMDKCIKIQLWDYQNSGKHRSMGEVETTTSEIVKRKTMRGNADKTGDLCSNISSNLILVQSKW